MKAIKLADFAEMENVNLSKIFAINQAWREGRQFVMEAPRPTNALLWFCGCGGVFRTADGAIVEAVQNDLVYIPQGARYELEFLNCNGYPSTVLAEFALSDGEFFVLEGGIRVIDADSEDGRFCKLLEKLVLEYSSPTKSTLKLKSDLYGLLAWICEWEKYKHIGKQRFQTVKKGIEYLQKDEKQELTIEEIAKMCFVTPAYFRRLFKEYAGISPSEYRTRRKMELAKELMEHSDLSVGELANLLGYTDPSYFCRVFKKEVGTSPSSFQKSVQKRKV